MGIDGSHLGVRSRGCNGEVELEDEPPLYEPEGGGVLALVSSILFILVAVMLLAMAVGFVSHVLAQLFAVGWNAVA